MYSCSPNTGRGTIDNRHGLQCDDAICAICWALPSTEDTTRPRTCNFCYRPTSQRRVDDTVITYDDIVICTDREQPSQVTYNNRLSPGPLLTGPFDVEAKLIKMLYRHPSIWPIMCNMTPSIKMEVHKVTMHDDTHCWVMCITGRKRKTEIEMPSECYHADWLQYWCNTLTQPDC